MGYSLISTGSHVCVSLGLEAGGARRAPSLSAVLQPISQEMPQQLKGLKLTSASPAVSSTLLSLLC